MTLTLNVSISQELGMRLKSMGGIANISRVCEEALMRETENQKIVSDDQALQNLVNSIRHGKTAIFEVWKQRGFQKAIDDWLQLESEIREDDLAADIYKKFFWIVEEDEIPGDVIDDFHDSDINEFPSGEATVRRLEAYKQGYLECLKSIYERIGEYLK